MGFSPGFEAGAKAHDRSRTLSRNAEALLPSAKAEGSHQTPGGRSAAFRVLTQTLQPVRNWLQAAPGLLAAEGIISISLKTFPQPVGQNSISTTNLDANRLPG
jgi:hypothetical protein